MIGGRKRTYRKGRSGRKTRRNSSRILRGGGGRDMFGQNTKPCPLQRDGTPMCL